MTANEFDANAAVKQAVPPRPPLTDRFGRIHTYLRVSVTERCNLRCRYCMPAAGIPWKPRAHLLTFEEIERLVRIYARMGITKVRLTGGEPTARAGLSELVSALVAVPGIETVGLTTNGMKLDQLAKSLRTAGLNRLNVSLDTLRPERFEQIARRPGLERVMAGIEGAQKAGFNPLRLNVVIIGGVNDDELEDFADWAQRQPIHVRFIEYMPFRDNEWQKARMIPWRDLLARLRRHWPLESTETNNPHAVARIFRAPGFVGTIGFIASMSEHFCDGCNRVRLTADGSLKSCLFQPAEWNLRDAMRMDASDEDLEAMIRQSLDGKWQHHPPAEELAKLDSTTMTEIGG